MPLCGTLQYRTMMLTQEDFVGSQWLYAKELTLVRAVFRRQCVPRRQHMRPHRA